MTPAADGAAVDFDFDSDPDETGLPPTCTFRLGGKTWQVKNDNLIDLATVNRMLSDQGMQVVAFFREVLVADEWEAFEQMLVNAPDGLTLGKTRTAMGRIAERILGFPTQASSSSSATSTGTRRKARSSSGRSSSLATPRKASGE